MKGKAWTVLLLTICTAMIAAGCGSKQSASTDNSNSSTQASSTGTNSAEKVTIKMMHLWPEGVSAGQNKIVNEIINEYQQENPNVTIKQEVLDNEQYKNKLKVLSASNELPDIGVTWAAGFLQPYVEGNLFTPLDDLLEGELKDKFVSGTTEAYKINDKTYGLPLEFNIAPIFYNKDLFAKNDLQVPTTYAELQNVVKVLSSKGIAPIALGNKDRWTGSLWYMYMADRIAGQQTLADAIQGKASFEDPSLVQAAQEVQSLVDSNAFIKGFNGLSNEEAKSEFLNEKAAMYLMGSWDVPNFTTNEDIPQAFRDKVGFFKFPTVDGGKGNIDSWVGGPGVGLFVAENSKVKDEAKKFVQYFIQKWGEQAVTGAGVIPATKVDAANMDLPQLYKDLFAEMSKASSVTLFADVQMPAKAAETHLNLIQALFGKAVTPQDFGRQQDSALAAK